METFNDYIKYYMETEMNPLIPIVVDKLELKKYAKDKGVLTPMTYTTGMSFQEVINKMMFIPNRFVVKNNADSGSAVICHKDGNKLNISGGKSGNPLERLVKFMFTPYGIQKGEWFYGPINPTLFSEEYIEDNTDYKFHCHNGEVKFLHIIHNRKVKAAQALYDTKGNELKYQFYHKMPYQSYPFPDNYKEMSDLATQLCKEFKYVRVDLFTSNNKLYLGELTFAPGGGLYAGEGQKELGELLK